MMTPWLVALVFLSMISTAFISGVLGMGGGALLMAILVLLLPINSAMIVHGFCQFISNGSRAYLFRKTVLWRGVGVYLIGVAIALVLFILIAYQPNKRAVFICLGALPFVSLLLPKQWSLNFERPVDQVICGFLVTVSQLFCGVSGPLLDIFFIKSSLNKEMVMGTKAVTQTIGHLAKLFYYGLWITLTDLTILWLLPLAFIAAVSGANLGKKVNERLEENQFRRYGQIVLLLVGSFLLYKGIFYSG